MTYVAQDTGEIPPTGAVSSMDPTILILAEEENCITYCGLLGGLFLGTSRYHQDAYRQHHGFLGTMGLTVVRSLHVRQGTFLGVGGVLLVREAEVDEARSAVAR